MRMVAKVVSEIQSAQYSIFNFPKNLRVLTYLSHEIPLFDDDTIWELSFKCERSSKEEQSPAFHSKFNLLETLFGEQQIVTKTSNPIFGLKVQFRRKKSM